MNTYDAGVYDDDNGAHGDDEVRGSSNGVHFAMLTDTTLPFSFLVFFFLPFLFLLPRSSDFIQLGSCLVQLVCVA